MSSSDRFENYHCDVKKAKAIPEKHISSRVMSHTKNESWPGIYRKIKKKKKKEDSIMKLEADHSRKGSYQYSLCRRAFKDKDMRGQQIWCSRLWVMTRREQQGLAENRNYMTTDSLHGLLFKKSAGEEERQGGNLMKQQDNEHVLLSMRSDAGFGMERKDIG